MFNVFIAFVNFDRTNFVIQTIIQKKNTSYSRKPIF